MTTIAAGPPVASHRPRTKIDLLIATRCKEAFDEAIRTGIYTSPPEVAEKVLSTIWLTRELAPLRRSTSGVYEVVVKYIRDEAHRQMQQATDARGQRCWENYKAAPGRYRWLPARVMTVRMHMEIAATARVQSRELRNKAIYHDAIARFAQERGLALDDAVAPIFEVIQPLAIAEVAKAA